MSRTKCTVDFSVWEEYARKIDRAGGDLKRAVEKALNESRDLVNEQLREAMKVHHRTGRTEDSIREEPVKWSGTTAEVGVGFSISKGGLPSVFLMYGTPTIPKDQKLYNAVYGTATKRKVRELQEKIFSDALKEAMGG